VGCHLEASCSLKKGEAIIYLLISLVAGLIYLISGKVKYNKTVYLEGTKARIAGLIFLAPVGLMLATLGIILILTIFGISISESSNKLIDTYASTSVRDGFMIGLAYINYYSVSRETKERGGCLTYGLAYMTLIAITLIYFLPQTISAFPGFKIVIISFVVFQIISIIGIWLWKKWGVWGFAVVTLISPVTNYLNTASVLQAFLSLIFSLSTILLLYLFVKPKWQFFE